MKHTFYHHRQQKNILCLITDGMNIRFSGAYGASLNLTPAFDELACDSVLFDQYYATRTVQADLYRQFWSGISSDSVSNPGSLSSDFESVPLPQLFQKKGYRTIYITDSESGMPLGFEHCFTDIHCLKTQVPSIPVNKTEETVLYDIFSQLGSIIASLRKESSEVPFFIWVHLRSLCQIWDAPLSWRSPESRETSLFNSDMPETASETDVYPEVQPPCLYFTQDQNKNNSDILEQIAKYREAFCAQLAVWDNVLAGLINYFTETGLWNDLLFLLGSGKGYPLGEHNMVGFPVMDNNSAIIPGIGHFYSETIHLPLLIHFPCCQYGMQRYSALTGPADLGPLLANWAGIISEKKYNLLSVIEDKTEELHPSLIIQEKDKDPTVRAILTREWYLITERQKTDSESVFSDKLNESELYVHPDDRWEVNNVANRCEGTVIDLLRELDTAVQEVH